MHTDKHARILNDLADVPEGKAVLFIRHADRDGHLNTLVDGEACLNTAGRENARSLGRSVRCFGKLAFVSSPVGRCVDTCSFISEGHGSKAPIEQTEVLGMRAPTMLKPREVYVLMQTMGLEKFVDEYVAGNIDTKLTLSCQRGSQLLYKFAIQKMESSDADLTVLVTHDMILTPGLVKYFGFDHHKNGLVHFLDGMVLYPEGDGYRVVHDGRSIHIGKDCLPPA